MADDDAPRSPEEDLAQRLERAYRERDEARALMRRLATVGHRIVNTCTFKSGHDLVELEQALVAFEALSWAQEQ